MLFNLKYRSVNEDASWNKQSVIGRLFGADNRPADNRPKHYRCTSTVNSQVRIRIDKVAAATLFTAEHCRHCGRMLGQAVGSEAASLYTEMNIYLCMQSKITFYHRKASSEQCNGNITEIDLNILTEYQIKGVQKPTKLRAWKQHQKLQLK